MVDTDYPIETLDLSNNLFDARAIFEIEACEDRFVGVTNLLLEGNPGHAK